MSADRYPLPATAHELTRLRKQSHLFQADAAWLFDHLGVGPGWRTLDLCCGPGGITDLLSQRVGATGEVIGLDYDPLKIAAAQAWATQRGLTNVQFLEGDGFATNLEPASFDLVHARWAIEVIAEGDRIFEHMLTLVKPGGYVVAQGTDISTWGSRPVQPAWETVLGVVTKVFADAGLRLDGGRDFFQLFYHHGLVNIGVRPCAHAVTLGDPMMTHLLDTFVSLRAPILAAGLMSETDFVAAETALQTYLSQPDTIVYTFSTIQCWGQV